MGVTNLTMKSERYLAQVIIFNHLALKERAELQTASEQNWEVLSP